MRHAILAEMRVRRPLPAVLHPDVQCRTEAHRAREENAEREEARDQLLPTLHSRLGRDVTILKVHKSMSCLDGGWSRAYLTF